MWSRLEIYPTPQNHLRCQGRVPQQCQAGNPKTVWQRAEACCMCRTLQNTIDEAAETYAPFAFVPCPLVSTHPSILTALHHGPWQSSIGITAAAQTHLHQRLGPEQEDIPSTISTFDRAHPARRTRTAVTDKQQAPEGPSDRLGAWPDRVEATTPLILSGGSLLWASGYDVSSAFPKVVVSPQSAATHPAPSL